MRPPVSDSNRRLVSASSADAPEKQTLIDLKSTLPVLHVAVIQEGDVERGHADEEGRFDTADRGQQIGEVPWIRHQRDRIAADKPESLDADVRVDVEERQRRDDHVALAAEHRPGPGLDLEARRRRTPRDCRARPWASRWCHRSSAARPDRQGSARQLLGQARRGCAGGAGNRSRRRRSPPDRRRAARAPA